MDVMTFGIELEFICIYPSHMTDPNDQDKIHKAIFKHLQDRGVDVTGFKEAGKKPDPQNNKQRYSRWRLEDECVELMPYEARVLPQGYDQIGMELVSRFFNLTKDHWVSEVKRVLTALRSIEDDEELGFKFVTNDYTGFHVHIGAGDVSIPLRTAKNICQFMTFMERFLDELHEVQRMEKFEPDEQSEKGYNNFSIPLSWFFGNSEYSDDETVQLAVTSWLTQIEEVASFKELAELFVMPDPTPVFEGDTIGSKRAAVNFNHLYADDQESYESSAKKTVEFRQHAGTLDIPTILHWIVMVAGIVRFCDQATDETLLRLFSRSIDKDFKMKQLLDGLLLPQPTTDYYTLRLTQPLNSQIKQSMKSVIGSMVSGTDTALTYFLHFLQSQAQVKRHPTVIQTKIKEKSDYYSYGLHTNVSARKMFSKGSNGYKEHMKKHSRKTELNRSAAKTEGFTMMHDLIQEEKEARDEDLEE